MRSRILFVSGHPEDAQRLSGMLDPIPVVLDHVQSVRHARSQLRQKDYDVVLTEAALPDGEWLDILHLVREQPSELPVVVTGRHADERLWTEALNLGVFDLMTQPFYRPEVQRILQNACKQELLTMTAI
jgi:DNA-binding NtrC family response regulator